MTRRDLLFWIGAQAGGPALFRADTSLARVGVRVLESGRVVPALGSEDFVVRENGTPQPVEHVSTVQEPLDLLIVLDISGSMDVYIRRLGEGAHAALAQLRPGDRAAIGAFHEWFEWVVRFSSDLRRVEKRMQEYAKEMWAGGNTFTTDALHSATNHMRRRARKDARRAILVVSDNVGSESGLFDLEKAVTRMLEADISVSALLVTAGSGRVDLRGIAERTGGYVVASSDAASALVEAVALIRGGYAVYYRVAPGQKGEKRKAVVELAPSAAARHPRARVRGAREFVLAADVP